MQNLVHGKRRLTPEVADRVLAALEWSLLDLASANELGEAMENLMAQAHLRYVPVLTGLIGPGHPFPALNSSSGWVPLPALSIRHVQQPVLAELGADPELSREFPGVSFALLETVALERMHVRQLRWYAVHWSGGGWVRRLRREGKRLIVQGQETLRATLGPQTIELGDAPLSQYLCGVVVWMGPDPRHVDPLGRGFYLAPPATEA
jgi:hypothetical protein